VSCTAAINVQNNGTVALTDLQVTSAGGTVDSCSPALASIAAGTTTSCTLTRVTTVAEFQAGSLSIEVAASAIKPKDSTAINAGPTSAYSVTLAAIKKVRWSFVRTASTDAVTAVGEYGSGHACAFAVSSARAEAAWEVSELCAAAECLPCSGWVCWTAMHVMARLLSTRAGTCAWLAAVCVVQLSWTCDVALLAVLRTCRHRCNLQCDS
jgi:hypothetical protein